MPGRFVYNRRAMAEPPQLALKDVTIGFGRGPLFTGLGAGIARGDKICLVGRNGCGKSTLLKLFAGLIEPDRGERFVQPGLSIAYLPQEDAFNPALPVVSYVSRGQQQNDGPARHRVEAALSRLSLAGERMMAELSGGEARRAALARALAGDPDILLLDEPTNHLDLPTIEWLERFLAEFAGGVLVISHDRAFLARLSHTTWWLDRGALRVLGRGFSHFERWSEQILEQEELARARLDKQIENEAVWLARGDAARRRRNEGRKRRLLELRAARAAWVGAAGRARLVAASEESRSRLVVDAEGLTKSWPTPGDSSPPRCVVRNFSIRIMRGDRIGIIGPNGAGKTTLIRLLTGEMAPDTGRLRLAKTLHPAYFDQRRAQLDPNKTLWQTLAPKGGDHVAVRGRPRHVVSYLRDFMFDERQAKSLVGGLSGGERNRLLLALTLARPSNLLVLDEPTNDLDMDTLDLLQEILDDYEGTLLVVSHDRDFLDRLVNGLLVVKGDGTIEEYAGGYSDYLDQAAGRAAIAVADERDGKSRRPAAVDPRQRTARHRLSYKEARDLESLPAEIERLSQQRRDLEAQLADPALYARDRRAATVMADELDEVRARLAAAEERWLELAARQETFERAKTDG